MPEPQGVSEGASNIERKDAELLVRGWNLLFNRSFSYAFAHPLVQETIPRVWELFRGALQRSGSLNIQLLEAMFFVDGIDVMYQPNNRRLADHMRRFKVESISLEPGFTLHDFSVLVETCSLTHPDAQAFLRFFQAHGGAHLDVNQVSLRAVRSDTVYGASPAGGSPDGGGDRFEDIVLRAMVGRLTTQELEGNVALVQMLADPQALGRAAIDGSKSLPPQVRAESMGNMVLNVLSQFAGQQTKQGFSVEELLAGIYSMRTEMMDMVRSQRSLDQGLAEEDVEVATDSAFDQTVCKIILTEYKGSKGNARRVSQVLGRVVPGKKELRRILPKLKDAFMAEGSSLQEWYALVKELTVVVQGDKALEELGAAASEMGVSPDEILGELRRDPKAAARLLVVSAEIRRAGGDASSDAAIQALLDSVDNAGDRLAEAGASLQDSVDAVRAYDKLHEEVRQQITTGTGMAPEVQANTLRKLDLRSHRTLSNLKAKVLANQLRDPDASVESKAATLGELVHEEGEIDSVLEIAMRMVGPDELARQVGLQIAERVRLRIVEERERAVSRELPQGVYPKAVTEFFLRYEARRAARYGVPFSAILVSFQGLPEDHESVERWGTPLRGLFHILGGDLRAMLRDVDFVGSLGFNRLLIVLPMTLEANSAVVVRKIREHLGREVALPDGQRVWVRPRLGVSSFDHSQADGLKEIMNKLSSKWQEDI